MDSLIVVITVSNAFFKKRIPESDFYQQYFAIQEEPEVSFISKAYFKDYSMVFQLIVKYKRYNLYLIYCYQ